MSDVDDSLLSQVRHLLWGGGWPVRRRCSVTLARWQNLVNKPASNQLVCNFYGRWPSGIEKTIVWGTRNGWKGGCIFLLLYDTVATWNNWFMAIHNSHTEGDEKKGRKTCIFLNILGSNFMPWSNGGRGAGFEENVIYAPQVFGCCCSLDTRQFNTSSQFGLKGQPPQKVNFCSTLTAGRHTLWQDFDRHSLLTNSSCYWPRGNLPWWRIIWSVRRVSRARSQRPTVWTQRLKKPAVTCSATRVNWNGFVVSYKTLT